MSLLESFLILFESDADDATKDIKSLDKALDDTEKTANNTTDATDSAGASFLDMGKKSLGAVGGVLALVSAVAGLAAKAQQLDQLGKFADRIGGDIQEIDAWGEAVIRAGGTAEGFQQTLESLNEKIVDASVRGTNEIVPFFNQLGISIVDVNGKAKSTLELLPELATAFEGLDRGQSLGLGKKLGLDVDTIALLQQGGAEVDAMIKRQKSLGVATAESAKLSAEFVDAMADFKQVSSFAAQNLLSTVIPAMTWLVESFTNIAVWMGDNKAIVFGFFIGLAAVAVPALFSLAAAGWAAIAPFLIAAAPFIAIGLAAATAGVAIALVVEDIIAFANGQDSLLGAMIEKWDIFGGVVGDIIDGISDGISGLFEVIGRFGAFIVDKLSDPLSMFDGLLDKFSEIKSFITFSDEPDIARGQQMIGAASSSPLDSQTSSSIQNSTSNTSKSVSVQVGDLTIQTQATDSGGIARTIGGSLEDQLRAVSDDFDDGVLA